MTDRWHKYFDDTGLFGNQWLPAAVSHWSFSERFRGTLLNLMPAAGRVLEIGCGPGFTGHLLASMGYSFTGIDSESRLIERATALGQQLGTDARFFVADAHDLSSFYAQYDLAFSAGVLEHFERAETVQLLREQARCARIVLISIPTPWTRHTGQITDERFYSVRQLRAITREAGLQPLRSFGYGDITANAVHLALYRLLPRALLRVAQNLGYSYSIAVAARSTSLDDAARILCVAHS
jgi:SAM-dependent methyltransferase